KGSPIDAVDPDHRRALEDDVNPGAAKPLPDDALAILEPGLVQDVGHLFELRSSEVGEEREGGDGVDYVALDRHLLTPPWALRNGVILARPGSGPNAGVASDRWKPLVWISLNMSEAIVE